MKRWLLLSFFAPTSALMCGVCFTIPSGAQYQYQNQYQNQNPQYEVQRSGPPGGALPETVPMSDSTIRMRRWEDEWKQQHPGEPVPNMGILQKMHFGETNALVQAGGRQMWANRQADLRRNYGMAKQMQQQKNMAQHITWSPQQWAAWDKQYDSGQQAQANAYLEGVRMSGEMARSEAFYKQNGFYPPRER